MGSGKQGEEYEYMGKERRERRSGKQGEELEGGEEGKEWRILQYICIMYILTG